MHTNEAQLPAFEKFISVQDVDAYCDQPIRIVRIHELSFKFDKNFVSVRNLPIGGAVQSAVPRSMEPIILNFETIQDLVVNKESVICTTQLGVNVIFRIY